MKYFKRKEFACKCGCGFDTVDYELAEVLDDLREHFGKPAIINSGCRCVKHNESVGGAKSSKHLFGIAVDVRIRDVAEEDVYEYLNVKYNTKYGLGLYNGRVHIDVRKNRARWNSKG